MKKSKADSKIFSYSNFNPNIASLDPKISIKSEKWRLENPELPFWKAFTEPLAPNSNLIIYGKVKDHAHKFTVNFVLDLKKESDIAFHFNPRLSHYVACNSKFDNYWDEEEAYGVSKVPFSRGTEFKLEFFVTQNEFLVAVDREHFCRFAHRSSPRQINKLEVFGDIVVYYISLSTRNFYPPSAVSENRIVADRLKLPYLRYFVEPVLPSTVIKVHGSNPQKAKSFALDLCTDWSAEPDIAFHFKPRLGDNYVACNTKRCGEWGIEEPNAWGKLPFKKSHTFLLEILINELYFLITVNGTRMCKYEHRVAPNKIKYFVISGDVLLTKVDVLAGTISSTLGIEEPYSGIIFHSLEIPFKREFVDPIVPKKDIIVSGIILKDAIRFSINLLTGSGDIAIHFNPRFDQNYVARNSLLGGSWGTEEAQASSRNPFQRSEDFILEMFVTRDEFLVSVNGTHFCGYSHRVPLSDIKYIEIDGDVKLTSVELNTKDHYPSVSSSKHELTLSSLQAEMETPLVYRLKEEVKSGSVVEIEGRVKLLPWIFYVNLQDTSHYWPHPQIGYHLSVRVTDVNPGIVFNSWIDNSWGKEEQHELSRRFIPGKEFVLKIICTRTAFSTSVDEQKVADFRHRVEPTSLNVLYIQGDVLISSIRIR